MESLQDTLDIQEAIESAVDGHTDDPADEVVGI